MKKHIALTTLFLMTVSPVWAGTSELTGKTLVSGDVVTVGDLFTHSGNHAKHILAPAPAAGKQLSLSNSDLKRVANAFKLDWTSNGDETATLQKNVSAISADEIIAALADSTLKDKISQDAEFKLDNVEEAIIVSGIQKPELIVGSTDFDPATEKFTAELVISRDGETLKTLALHGVATIMTEIPVLKYAMASNGPISAGDIGTIKVPAKQLRGDIIASKEDLIGMTPKRSLQGHTAISHKDVNPPLMIKRNDLVTIIYKNGPIVLSAKARSLGDGARGETVTFMNTESKKSFEAKVTGPQQAEVNLNV